MRTAMGVPDGLRRIATGLVLALLALAAGRGAYAKGALLGAPEVKSSFVVVMDAADSSVLYSRQADVPVPVASITKLMTALVVLEAGQPMDEVLQITREDVDTLKGTGSRLTVGTRLSREDALILALMASENRAASALGRHYPGGLAAAVRAMNAKAEALGMTRTHFAEPTGLSSRNVSTAADIAKLVVAASENPVIRRFSTQEKHTLVVGRQHLEFHNTNRLVRQPDWEIAVQKTGYTREAGRCLALEAIIENRPVVMVLLNSFGTLTRIADAKRIRRWMEGATDVLQATSEVGGGTHASARTLAR